MKQAYIRYICNGYSLLETDQLVLPEPAWRYGATVAEIVYHLGQFFEGVDTHGSPPGVPGPFTPSVPTLQAVDLLMNQEAQVWPLESGGYNVRQMPSPSVPGRPALDEFCPNMDAVALELGSIYSDNSVIPTLPPGEILMSPAVAAGGNTGAILFSAGPATRVLMYRIQIDTEQGRAQIDVPSSVNMNAQQLAQAFQQAINANPSFFVTATRNGADLQLAIRDADNSMIFLTCGLATGAQTRARRPVVPV
jgi:hypothetical protein